MSTKKIEATINNSSQTKGKFSPVPAIARSPTRLKKIPKIKGPSYKTKEVSLESSVLYNFFEINIYFLFVNNPL